MNILVNSCDNKMNKNSDENKQNVLSSVTTGGERYAISKMGRSNKHRNNHVGERGNKNSQRRGEEFSGRNVLFICFICICLRGTG